MSVSFWLDQSKKATKKTSDVIIVGAGLSGFATAYWLKRRDPSMKITILEKDRIAYGASGRNGGFITCGSVEHFNRMVENFGEERAFEIWRYSEKNLELLKEHIIHPSKNDLSFEQIGTFSLATQDAELKEFQQIAELMDKGNIKVESLGPEDIDKRVGVVGFTGGIKYLDDATINPVSLVNELALRAEAEVHESTQVFSWESTADGNRVVHTDRGDYEAPIVILALNGFLSQLHPYFKEMIYATRGQVLMTEPVPRFMEGACYANFYLDYFRQIPTGELLIGGFRQIEKESEFGYSDHTTDIVQNALENFVRRHIPRLETAKITHRWSGIMGFSKDSQPVIGSLPEDPQVFFLGGYTGHGLGLFFNTSKCLVDMIYGEEFPEFISAKRPLGAVAHGQGRKARD